MVKKWDFSGKFDQHLSLYCGSVKPKFKTRARILVLVKVLWVTIAKIYWQFWHSFVKYTCKNNFYSIEIMWGKMARSVCLKPVSVETLCLHTLWRFTVLTYDYWLEPIKIIIHFICHICSSFLLTGIPVYWGPAGQQQQWLRGHTPLIGNN